MVLVQSYSTIPMTPRTSLLLLLLACILLTAGCTMPFAADNHTDNSTDTSTPASLAKYKQTIAQPGDTSQLIKMDSDVYNIGEVVEFFIRNEKTGDLSCTHNPPAFSVRYQTGSGRWVTRMGEENPAPGTTTILKPGESTAPYRFVTDGWAYGRYRIVSDCGVSREILLRKLPPVTTTVPPCPPVLNTSPYIRVNPVSDQYRGIPFTIAGTTSLPAGTDLRYSIFAITSASTNLSTAKLVSSSTTVSEGSCGTNTWFVEGVIESSGDYFIGISNNANTVSAVRRFSVLPEARPTVTATLPEKSTAPGISTEVSRSSPGSSP